MDLSTSYERRQNGRVCKNGDTWLLYTKQMRRHRRLVEVRDFSGCQEGIDFLMRGSARKENAFLLEIGCGYGNVTRDLQIAYPHLRTTGIDIAPWALIGDRHWNPPYNWFRRPVTPERSSFVVSDGAHLPFADESFDAVFSFWTLPYIPDPLRVVREAHRVLKPEGRAFFSVTTGIEPLDRLLPWVKYGQDPAEALAHSDAYNHYGDIYVVKRGNGLPFDKDGWEFNGSVLNNWFAALPLIGRFIRPDLSSSYVKRRACRE